MSVFEHSDFLSLRFFTMSTHPISAANAMCDLTAMRNVIDGAQAELLVDVRRVLRPAGFGRDPEEWVAAADAVLNALNQDYRHEAKVEIMENARKIARKGGLDKLTNSLVDMARVFDTAQTRLRNFETMYEGGKARLPEVDRLQYSDALNTFNKLIVVLELELSTGRRRLNDNKAMLLALGAPTPDVRRLIQPLNSASLPDEAVASAKAWLHELAELSSLRSLVETRSGALFAITSRIVSMWAPFTPEGLEAVLAKYAVVQSDLDELTVKQGRILMALQEDIDVVASSPPMLPNRDSVTDLCVADLRGGFQVFTEIYDAVEMMQEVNGPFFDAMERATAQLRGALELRVGPNVFVML
ncbi:hypothetical protein C2E23DRAFT_810990 [Lenzites betulinus]|nr:hypothetical protein C2E23DRAFT_810990 [Lenzites betulinus]